MNMILSYMMILIVLIVCTCVVLVLCQCASLGLPRACEIWAPALRVRHATQATPNNASYRQIMYISFPGVRFKRGSRS